MKLQLTQYKLKNKAMKTKILMIFLMIMIATTMFGQKIKTSGSIELGWSDFGYAIYKNNNDLDGNHYGSEKNTFYANIKLGVTFFKYFNIDNELETFFSVADEKTNFNPNFANYTIDFNAKYKYVQAGYRHQCIHPILNTANYFNAQMFGGYDKIYVKFTLF